MRRSNPVALGLLLSGLAGQKLLHILCQLAQIFLNLLKNKIILSFVKFMATKKARQPIFFPFLFVVVVGSGTRNPKNQDPGSGIYTPDTQHWSGKLKSSKTLGKK